MFELMRLEEVWGIDAVRRTKMFSQFQENRVCPGQDD